MHDFVAKGVVVAQNFLSYFCWAANQRGTAFQKVLIGFPNGGIAVSVIEDRTEYVFGVLGGWSTEEACGASTNPGIGRVVSRSSPLCSVVIHKLLIWFDRVGHVS